MALALTDLDTIKDELGLSGSTEDDRLTRYWNAAQSTIYEFCARDFDGNSERTEVVDGQGTNVVMVAETPIISLTSVSILFPDATSQTVSSGRYTHDANTGEITLHGHTARGFEYAADLRGPSVWPKRKDAVQVVYTGGYTTAQLASTAAPIQQTCLELITMMYRNRGVDQTMQSENFLTGSWSRMSSTDQFAWLSARLGAYRARSTN